jgi:hypothetical protein
MKPQLTNGKKNFQFWVGLLKIHNPLIQTNFPIFRLVIWLKRREFALFQPSEGKDRMSAKIRVYVFGQELAVFRSVLRPVGVVTHYLQQKMYWTIGVATLLAETGGVATLSAGTVGVVTYYLQKQVYWIFGAVTLSAETFGVVIHYLQIQVYCVFGAVTHYLQKHLA